MIGDGSKACVIKSFANFLGKAFALFGGAVYIGVQVEAGDVFGFDAELAGTLDGDEGGDVWARGAGEEHGGLGVAEDDGGGVGHRDLRGSFLSGDARGRHLDSNDDRAR